jgi:lipopolysaccharide export system protein LptA
MWVLRGSPVVIAWGAARLEAAEVRYDERRAVAEASGGVVLRQEMLVLRSARVTAWLRRNLVTAEEGVEVTAQRGADEVRLTAAWAETDLARRKVAAGGDPVLTFRQMRLAGVRLEFDAAAEVVNAAGDADLSLPEGRLQAGRIEAHLVEERATAEHDVRLSAGDLLAQAPLAALDGRASVVTLSAGVVVRRGFDTLTAEVVTVDLRARLVTATGRPRLTMGGQGQ